MQYQRVTFASVLIGVLAACGGGDDSDSRDDASPVASSDAAPHSDAVVVTPDATSSTADAGTPADAGEVTDAGTPADAGVVTDAGNQVDANTPIDASAAVDATVPPDATQGPDSGAGPDTAQLCADLCTKYSTCTSTSDPSCQSDCIATTSDGCTPDELTALAGCATAACSDYDSCVAAIQCVSQESYCGDGSCHPQWEDCSNCAADCGVCVCGNDNCEPGECDTCASDCPGSCGCGEVCEVGSIQDPGCGGCAATICNLDSACCSSNWDAFCVIKAEVLCELDCPPVCGDVRCETGETPVNCPDDCF